jgi:hypothetical protein
VDLSQPMAGPGMNMPMGAGVPHIRDGFRRFEVDVTMTSRTPKALHLDPGAFTVDGLGGAFVTGIEGDHDGRIDRPALIVKIDNVPQARPGHTGLQRADIIYATQVEGGLSRLMAVYSAVLPPRIGPVRSVRESDLELLPVFGRPVMAYSGARSALAPDIAEAPVLPVEPARNATAFFRSRDLPAPHNLYLRPHLALSAARGASLADDIGFRFGAAPPGGTPTASHTVGYPRAEFGFSWSADAGRWLVSMDGEAATDEHDRQLTAATVVVQHTTVRPSRFPGTPYTETVGSGTAVVLRDGQAHEARWERPAATEGTVFTDRDGNRLNFARGPVWVVLAPE